MSRAVEISCSVELSMKKFHDIEARLYVFRKKSFKKFVIVFVFNTRIWIYMLRNRPRFLGVFLKWIRFC